ncbi:hypothetical protein KKC59_00725 [bacterium]|nr:hypothetical protein [bacterium]
MAKKYVAILYSIDQEITFLKKSFCILNQEKLGRNFVYVCKDKDILLYKIGVGEKNIKRNLKLFTERFDVEKFVLIGFAGAVSEKLRVVCYCAV